MTPESGIPTATDVSSAPRETGTPNVEGSSPSSPGTGTPSFSDVQPTPVQGQEPTAPAQDDPLAGVPSLDELKPAIEQNTPYAKALAQLRGAYETLKPQLGELSEKFKPFEPYADRFTKPEEVQEVVDLKEKLFGFERDNETQRLIPSTQSGAQYITEKYPDHADYLTADLLQMEVRDPETGRVLPRIDLVLEAMAATPAERAKALQILGGVEPTSIAPTWAPTAEELAVIPKNPERVTPEDVSLQEIYKKLPYDKRESLKLNEPEFIREYLADQKFKQDLIEQNRQSQERETRQQQQREQYVQTQARDAGNEAVEKEFKQGFQGFAQSIVERSQFIKPLDPQSPEAQQLGPEGAQQANQEIQKINTGVGMMISTVVAALSHPDTRFVAESFLKSVGIDDKTISEFDNARVMFAQNTRDYGELNYLTSQQQNGNGQGQAGLGALQSNAARAMRDMKARGNLVAKPLLELMSKFFEMKAGSYNQTLNGAAVARPPIQGQPFDPTTTASQPAPKGWMSRQEIERLAGA